jgi:predicted metalloendopeptidase
MARNRGLRCDPVYNNALFRFRSDQDYKDSTRVIAEVDQGGIGLPDRDETKRLRATIDPHSPDKYRANGVVSNLPEFQERFTAKPARPW